MKRASRQATFGVWSRFGLEHINCHYPPPIDRPYQAIEKKVCRAPKPTLGFGGVGFRERKRSCRNMGKKEVYDMEFLYW